MLLSALAALICGAGILNIKSETEGEKLWIPQNSKIVENYQWLEDNVGPDAFFARLLISSNGDDLNVLRPELIDELFQLDAQIRSIVSGNNCTFDTCLCGDQSCFVVGNIMDNWCGYEQYRAQVLESPSVMASFLEGVNRDILCDGRRLSPLSMIGLPVYDDFGKIVSGTSLRVSYITNAEDDWLHKFRKLALGFKTIHMKVTVLYSASLDEEVEKVVSKDIFLVAVCFMLMFVVLCFLFFRRDLVKSRMILAVCGEISILLSMLMGYGIAMVLGVPFTTLSQMLPFIVVAIGVDDMLVLFQTLEMVKRTYPELPLEEKFQKTLKDAGISITITSLTNMLAFILGMFTVIPAIEYFSVYAALTIFADFLLQLSFFLSCMVLVEMHEERSKTAHFCSYICPGPKLDKLPVTALKTLEPKAVKISFNEISFHTWIDYFRKPFWVVMPIPLRIGVLVVTLLAVIMSLVFVGDLKEGLPLQDLAADDSYVQDYYDLNDRTFQTQIAEDMVKMYFKGVDQTDPSVQFQMLQAKDTILRRSEYATLTSSEGGLSPDLTWLHQMVGFALQNNLTTAPCASLLAADKCANTYVPLLLIPQENFYPILDAFLEQYPDKDQVIVREGNVMVDGKQKQTGPLLASTFPFYTEAITEIQWASYYVDLMGLERELNKELFPDQDSDVILLLDITLLFAQQQLVLWDEAIQNLCLAGAGVLFLCSLTLIHPLMTLYMGLVVFLIDTFLFGLMYAVGVRFNSVSLIIIIMAIGLSIDYSMHVMHCFLTIKAETKSERAFQSLQKMGIPVMMGAATTLVGILPLAFSSSVIFRVFFQMLFATAGSASYVGLIIMPIVLSMVGPPPLFAVDEK